MSVFERVRGVIVRTLKEPEGKVTEDALLYGDLAKDSLDLVERTMAFEDEFEIEIPEEEAEKLKTVGDTVKYLTERGVAS